MIDFRYHLVSLVSVFLALAVGIVLGAGPLEGSIGRTLTDQVEALRADRDSLRQDLGRAEQGVAHRETFITDVTPALVASQLGGRSVVVVTLPGVPAASLNSLDDALEESGATVTGQIALTGKWVDEAAADERASVVDELAAAIPTAPAGLPSQAPPTSVEGLLAAAVLATDVTQAGAIDATGQKIVQGLQSAELLSVTGDLSRRAGEAVIVAPPVSPTAATATEGSDSGSQAWRDLAVALDRGSDGAVVLGPASSAGQGGLIYSIRSDERASAAVSTVDTGGTAMGPVTTVLALSEQLRGSSGAYGFADGAQAPLPEIDTTASATSPTATP